MYIYCAILGDNTAFPIDIDPTMTVGHLKVEIKRCKHTLDSIDADILRLFWVECPMPQEIYSALMASIQQGTVQFDRKIELGFPPCILSTIPFAPGNLHILVEVPAAAENPAMQHLSGPQHIDSMLFFTAREKGVFTPSLLVENSIVETTAVPDFLRPVRAKLIAPRSINIDDWNFLCRTTSFNTTSFNLVPFFELTNGNPDCSHHEIAHYASHFFDRPPSLSISTVLDKRGGGGAYYEYIGAYLCRAYSEAIFHGEGTWPFSLVAQVETAKYSHTPRSDFLLLLDGCPFLIFEVCSDRAQEYDRSRMLLQAAVLVRTMNSFRPEQGEYEPFIGVAIYINSKFTAERYLVGQFQPSSSTITYFKDEFNLKTPSDAFRFFFELHNLPYALPLNNQFSGTSSKLQGLFTKVRNAALPGFTSRSSKSKPANATTDIPIVPENGTLGDGNPLLTHRLSELGIQLKTEEECPGWTPLNPLPPNLRRGRTSDGNPVVLKLVESRELEIHSFLSRIESLDNHTIPILHEVALGTKAILVMPDRFILPDVAPSVFENSGNNLASQFLAGVRFMHQQNVAHLDLKPDNILITLKTSLQLHICDYDLSAQVAGPDSWMTGYRGTPGWTAPEIEEDPGKPYQPIRADLWSTGRVMEYIASHQPPHTSLFEELAKKLLADNPLERPLLSTACILPEEQPPLKQKPSI